ncbi:hypothetical protein CFP65_3177 [Kitasatospora sp. MMS16-BH015]|uniref:hypothetical protein n=1 Tax=Kitasatospora sp. MMS16-BH015 TaxID=2018025 RepID=UPI000CA14092|nr:hypothetical protein [Kitasatospora sp. MMS16-BH015]AUG77981.1 hypothetical protein CFP65_3177 [Kitasatospora sp. MMS16-BH015]
MNPYPTQQSSAPAPLHPGETVLGSFDLELDPLLPLYFDPSRFAGAALAMPFRYLWDGFRASMAMLAPPVLRELLSLDTRYQRRYGLYPMTRLYRAIRRPLHGGSWHGGRESTAGRFWLAVRTSPINLQVDHKRFTLVLTDRRLLALYGTRPVLELPRGSYGLRPGTPDSWFTKRVDLAFADGSWLALSAGRWFFGYNEQEEAKATGLTHALR